MGNFTCHLSPAHHAHRLTCRRHHHFTYKNFTADIAGCADISSISTANFVAGDTNIAACTAYGCFLYNACTSAFTA
jgi:hypothetical protein